MDAPVIPPWFVEALARMDGLRNPPSSPNMHWEGLQTMPREVLARAITKAITTRQWFPTPAEIREDADATRQPVSLPAPGEQCCEDCGDTGWKDVETEKGRAVTRCGCVESNPVIQQKRDATRKYAEARSR